MQTIPMAERALLSEPVVERRLRHSVAVGTCSAEGLAKAMFFIFRYLCCTRMVCPRMAEPGPGASIPALRCRNGRVRRGDKYGREAVLPCAQPTGTECARCAIYDLR